MDPLWGVDFQIGHLLVKMYVKMKEMGPIWGMHQKFLCVDPPMDETVGQLFSVMVSLLPLKMDHMESFLL